MKKLAFLLFASLAFASCSDELNIQSEEQNVNNQLNVNEELSDDRVNKNWNFSLNYNKGFGEAKADSVANAISTSDGGMLIVGHTSSFNPSQPVDFSRDALIIKLNGSGEQQWSIRRDYNNLNKMDEARGVLELSDGYLVSGFSFFGGGGFIVSWILKVDINGNYTTFIEEVGQVNDNNMFVWNSIVPSHSSGYVLCGNTSPGTVINTGPGYLFIREIDTEGNTVNERSFINTKKAKGSEIILVPNGYLIKTKDDLIKLGVDLNVVWSRSFTNFDFKAATFDLNDMTVITVEYNTLTKQHRLSRWSHEDGSLLSEHSWSALVNGDLTTINDVELKFNGNLFAVGNRVNTSNNVSSTWLVELTPQAAIVGQKFWISNISLNQFTQIAGRSLFSDTLTDYLRLAGTITAPGQNIPSHNGGLDIWAMGIQF
jgi:hypothetical protein